MLAIQPNNIKDKTLHFYNAKPLLYPYLIIGDVNVDGANSSNVKISTMAETIIDHKLIEPPLHNTRHK